MKCPFDCGWEGTVEEYLTHFETCPKRKKSSNSTATATTTNQCSLILDLVKGLVKDIAKEFKIFIEGLAPVDRPAYNIFVLNQRLQGIYTIADKLNCPNMAEIEKLIAEAQVYARQIRLPAEISPKPTIIFTPTIEEKYAGFKDLNDPVLLEQIKLKLADWGRKYWEAARTRGKAYSSQELLNIIDAFGKLNVSLAFGLPNELFDLLVERFDKIFPEYVLGIKKRGG